MKPCNELREIMRKKNAVPEEFTMMKIQNSDEYFGKLTSYCHRL
jgi:hypothetical protein